MKNYFLIKLIFLLILISGCETIKKKTDEIAKKENKKLSQFIGQPVSELKIEMGYLMMREKAKLVQNF